MINHTIGHVRAGVNECLAKTGINPNEIPNLSEFLSRIEHPFQGIHSTFLQEKFYREKLECTVSTDETLWCL